MPTLTCQCSLAIRSLANRSLANTRSPSAWSCRHSPPPHPQCTSCVHSSACVPFSCVCLEARRCWGAHYRETHGRLSIERWSSPQRCQRIRQRAKTHSSTARSSIAIILYHTLFARFSHYLFAPSLILSAFALSQYITRLSAHSIKFEQQIKPTKKDAGQAKSGVRLI